MCGALFDLRAPPPQHTQLAFMAPPPPPRLFSDMLAPFCIHYMSQLIPILGSCASKWGVIQISVVHGPVSPFPPISTHRQPGRSW